MYATAARQECGGGKLYPKEAEMTFGATGYALGEDEGDAIWFFNGLFVVKAAAAETKNAFTLIEVKLPPGGGAPPHIHHGEEEGFYILEGELTVNCGEQS